MTACFKRFVYSFLYKHERSVTFQEKLQSSILAKISQYFHLTKLLSQLVQGRIGDGIDYKKHSELRNLATSYVHENPTL